MRKLLEFEQPEYAQSFLGGRLRLSGKRRGEEAASQGGEERTSVHKEPPPDQPSGGNGAMNGQAG
jgi:hypothetical protein